MRLYVLNYGRFEVFSDGRIIGIQGFLIRTSDLNILVDTGFPPWYVSDPVGAAAADGLDFGRLVELTASNLPAAQLARAGLAAEDITHLVITHTHIDHVGGLGGFPGAAIVIGRRERELPQPLYWGSARRVEWPANQRYLLVEEDSDLAPGVKLLMTPGHTPGHVSVLVRLPRTGPVILTGDAISRPEEIERDAYHAASDEAQVRASARRLTTLAKEEGAWIIYGHSPIQWPQLKKAPDFYD
jgi:N-acyl homoserine lactone hydrolase